MRLPEVTPTVTVRADEEPRLGSYALGDIARFRLTSAYHRPRPDGTPGLDTRMRIVAWTVTPGQVGQDDTVTLTLAPVRA